MSPLAALLQRERELVDAFTAILESEQAALRLAEADALPALAEQKVALAERLNASGAERNLVLRAQGLPPDREGMLRWLAKNRTDREAIREWQQLMKLAANAQELNRVNGVLINLHLQNTQQAIAAITQGNDQGGLYNQVGQATRLTGSRLIDSA